MPGTFSPGSTSICESELKKDPRSFINRKEKIEKTEKIERKEKKRKEKKREIREEKNFFEGRGVERKKKAMEKNERK